MPGYCELASEILALTNFCREMRLNCDFRGANRNCIGNSDVREEAVPAAGNGFHKAWTRGGVAEGLTDFVDRFVEPVVEIHERVCGPEFFLKLLASYYLAAVLKQDRQDLERLFLKPDS
jgi:hypothetical protein